MSRRVAGQLSLADGLVSRRPATMLDRMSAVLDWQAIAVVLKPVEAGAGRGAPGYPALVLLRALLLGIWHGLSDEALEAAIWDRLSFRQFVGLGLGEPVPDHSTLWRFREALGEAGLAEAVLAEITRQLDDKGLILRQGTLIDASLVQARARPPGKPRRAEQQPRASLDADARWGRKGAKSVFGYKIHIGVDDAHTLIRKVVVSHAAMTDTEPADRLICGDERAVLGDQAYYTHARHASLIARGIKDRLMRRPNKHHPELPPRHKQRNRLIAGRRAAVERPFAVFKERYRLRRLRFFNLLRNATHVLLAAFAYNLRTAAGALDSV